MASYFPLYACVALFVSFGSVICAGGRGEASSSSEHWMSEKKMTNVTLIKPFKNNEKLKGGFIQSKLVKIDGNDVWCWDFYDFDQWDNVNGGTSRDPDQFYYRFIEDGIHGRKRKGRKVDFGYKPEGASLPLNYIFDFANEADAINFTGEAPAQKCQKFRQLFSSCV